MRSPVISDSQRPRQLTLELDESALSMHGSLRDCVAQGVYGKYGLKRVAAELNMAPGNLSVALSENESRKLGVDELETYIEKFGDLTPIYWLINRFLKNDDASRDHALQQIVGMLQRMPGLADAAGLELAKQRRSR